MFLFEAGLSIFGIRLYAICILIGILIAVYAAIKEGKKLGIFSDDIYLGVVIIVPISIIGARLWYILFNLDDGWDFGKIIGLDGGLAGLAIQGGVIAAIISTIIYCKKKKLSLYSVFDIVAPGFLIGQVCGRWGNFFNKELYGPAIQNEGLFKTIFPKFITENMKIGGTYYHPTFLYESVLNFIGLVIMLVLRRKYKKLQSGDLIGVYLVWYGVVRSITETLRSHSGANEVLMLGPIKVSILISILFIIGGIAFIILKRRYGTHQLYQEIIAQVASEKIDTILFDLDGTLTDSKALVLLSFSLTFEHFMPELQFTDEEREAMFGPPLYKTFGKYTTDSDLIEQMITYYREKYDEYHNETYIKVFPYAASVLKKLNHLGYKLGVVTTKSRKAAIFDLDTFKLSKYFHIIVSGDDVKNPKPSPDGILYAMSQLESKNALYIGDNASDIQAGINANVKTCSLLYSSFYDECEKLNPTYSIKDLSGLYKILDE